MLGKYHLNFISAFLQTIPHLYVDITLAFIGPTLARSTLQRCRKQEIILSVIISVNCTLYVCVCEGGGGGGGGGGGEGGNLKINFVTYNEFSYMSYHL